MLINKLNNNRLLSCKFNKMSKRTTFAYHDKMLDIRLAEGHF